ncbi:MAG: hypothetical protein RBR39_07915 [Proteiniphilum sp.]|nr:hypothetical protein [Proteiniphilum sp.]
MDKYGYLSSFPFLLDWVHGNEALPDGDPLVRSEIMIRASQRRRIKAAGINLSQQVREWIDRDFPD